VPVGTGGCPPPAVGTARLVVVVQQDVVEEPVADVLGHSPDMLMKVYAHAMPESTRAIANRIGARVIAPPDG